MDATADMIVSYPGSKQFAKFKEFTRTHTHTLGLLVRIHTCSRSRFHSLIQSNRKSSHVYVYMRVLFLHSGLKRLVALHLLSPLLLTTI